MLPTTDVLGLMRARGHRMPLTEGGPHLVGQLTAEDLPNELFLTIAPILADRDDIPRPGIAEQEILPAQHHPADLVSARRRRSYLFLRYQFHRSLTR